VCLLDLEAYAVSSSTFRTAASGRPKCLATCAGVTPARSAACTALRCPSCNVDEVLPGREDWPRCFEGCGLRRSRNTLAFLTAAFNSGRLPLPASIRFCNSSMSWPRCFASCASDRPASSHSSAEAGAGSDRGVGTVSVTSNRSRVRGEDPLCGIGFIWAFSRSDPSFEGVHHTVVRGIEGLLVPVGWEFISTTSRTRPGSVLSRASARSAYPCLSWSWDLGLAWTPFEAGNRRGAEFA
jgi:hypothetical protein